MLIFQKKSVNILTLAYFHDIMLIIVLIGTKNVVEIKIKYVIENDLYKQH